MLHGDPSPWTFGPMLPGCPCCGRDKSAISVLCSASTSTLAICSTSASGSCCAGGRICPGADAGPPPALPASPALPARTAAEHRKFVILGMAAELNLTCRVTGRRRMPVVSLMAWKCAAC